MPSALSIDLRERVVAALADGASCHGAAARFGVSVSSASRWAAPVRQEGQIGPCARGDDQRPQVIEAQADLILATYEREPQLLLREFHNVLAA